MKIVSSFLFSEIFEKELLLLKLALEDLYVNEWLLLENSYSFQGDYKGLHAAELIKLDERFSPYRDKVTVIAKEVETKKLSKDLVLDDEAFQIEYWQRDLAHDYFVTNYEENDWILIADVDEMIDFSDASRSKELLTRMREDETGLLHISNKRYWYDFDNEYKPLRGIPICTKNYLQQHGKKLHQVRSSFKGNILAMEWNQIISFEYSSCFNVQEIFRKLETNSHMAYKMDELKQSLRCNHRPVSSVRGLQIKKDDKFFFETIELNEQNSPKIVRDHLQLLKTNNIDKNYKENRLADYPFLFTGNTQLKETVKHKINWLSKMTRQVCRILKIEKLLYK